MTAHTMSPARRSPRELLAIGLAAAGLVVGACGSTEPDETSVGVADLPAADRGQETSDPEQAEAGTGRDDGGRPEPSDADIEAASLEFEQCMADAGVDVSGLFGGGGGEAVGDDDDDGNDANAASQIDLGTLDDDEFQAAMDECNKIFEDTFGSFEPSPEEQARLADAEAAFANCMSEAGFEIPEADGSGIIAFELDDEVDLDAIDEATEQCSAEAFGENGLILGSEVEEG